MGTEGVTAMSATLNAYKKHQKALLKEIRTRKEGPERGALERENHEFMVRAGFIDKSGKLAKPYR